MSKKKILLVSCFLLITALLAACGGAVQPATEEIQPPVAAEGQNPQGFQPPEGGFAGPGGGSAFGGGGVFTNLALGTLYLQETDAPITPEQAAELLPLWQTLLERLNAEEVDPDVISGSVDLIESSLTVDQRTILDGLEPQDLISWGQEQGLMPEFEGGDGQFPFDENFTPPADFTPFADFTPPADFTPGANQGPPPDFTPQPGGGPRFFGGQNTELVEAVIAMLSDLVASS